jgi:hypothetical protein
MMEDARKLLDVIGVGPRGVSIHLTPALSSGADSSEFRPLENPEPAPSASAHR